MVNVSKAKVKKPLSVIVADPSLCTGCQICMLACSLYNGGECGPSLSRIKIYSIFSEYTFRINLCMQCEYPPCLYHCPVGAIKIDENNGIRYVEDSKCTGCLICTKVCPFNAIFKDPRSNGKVIKCDLCRSRESGPICVELCPTNSLKIVRWKHDLFRGEKNVWMERKHTESRFDEKEDLKGKNKQIC